MFALILSLVFKITTASVSFAADGSADELDLGRIWIQDRTIKVLAQLYLTKPDSIKPQIQSALEAALEMKSKPEQVQYVETIKDLEQIREEFIRSETSLTKDVQKVIQKNLPEHLIIRSHDPEVQKHIARINEAYRNKLDFKFDFPPRYWWVRIAESVGVIKVRSYTFFSLLFEKSRASNLFAFAVKKAVRFLNIDRTWQTQIAKADAELEKYESLVTDFVDKKSQSITDPAIQEGLKIAINTYLQDAPEKEKIKIGLQIAQYPESDSPEELLKILIHNSGPHLQKIAQVIGRHKKVPQEMREIFKSCEEDLPAAPKSYVIDRMREIKRELLRENIQLLSYELEPIAVASVAQVHRVKVKLPNAQIIDAALRIFKPDITEAAHQEEHLMDRVIENIHDAEEEKLRRMATMADMVEDVKTMLHQELKVNQTVHAQRFAKEVLSVTRHSHDSSYARVRFEVPSVIWSNSKLQAILMPWMEGESFDDFKDAHPNQALTAIEVWTRLWLEKTLLAEGFVHADPHAGNLKFKIDSDGTIVVTVLDYGLSGRANRELQSKFILLGASAELKAYSVTEKFIWDLANQHPSYGEQEFRRRYFDFLKTNPDEGLEGQIIFAIEEGLRFPLEFTILSRSYFITQTLLDDVGSEKSIGDHVKDIFRDNPSAILIARHFPKYLSTEDIAHLAHGALRLGVNALIGRSQQFVSISQRVVSMSQNDFQAAQLPITCESLF